MNQHLGDDDQSFSLPYMVNGLATHCAGIATALNADNFFILIILLALLVANFPNHASEFEVGTLFMYIFFAVMLATWVRCWRSLRRFSSSRWSWYTWPCCWLWASC